MDPLITTPQKKHLKLESPWGFLHKTQNSPKCCLSPSRHTAVLLRSLAPAVLWEKSLFLIEHLQLKLFNPLSQNYKTSMYVS